MNAKNTIISLCDYSGRWAKPWFDAGFNVILVDPKHVDSSVDGMSAFSGTVSEFIESNLFNSISGDVYAVLVAPPCTHFSGSGARWWPEKDAAGLTNEATGIVRDCLSVIDLCKPKVWAIENPVGRIAKLVPELGSPFYFHPSDYALLEDAGAYTGTKIAEIFERKNIRGHYEAYTKKTGLWGEFNAPEKAPVEPVMIEQGGKRGSWMWAYLGGKSEQTKTLRSNTPTGFARAFFDANKPDANQ